MSKHLRCGRPYLVAKAGVTLSDFIESEMAENEDEVAPALLPKPADWSSHVNALLKPILSILVSTQIAVTPLLAHADQRVVSPAAPTAPTAPSPTTPSQAAPTLDQVNGDIDPVLQEFQRLQPTSDFKLSFDAKDPAIDQDPYFMRAQSWLPKQTNQLSFARTANDITIEIPEAKKALKLNLPLIPIQATDDYVFFSLDKASDLFRTAAGAGEQTGEGLFFLSRHDLDSEKPAQVFYYPLAGRGWTGALNSISLLQSETLVVANENESVTISLRDVESAMKVEQMNLMIAQTMTSKNNGALAQIPARGSTAAFGMLFTGLDLDHPSKSMWAASPHGSTNTLVAKLGDLVNRLMPTPAAQAFDPALNEKLIHVGTALSAMMFASIVIKSKNPAIRKKLEARSAGAKTKIARAKANLARTFDVFASVTATSAQMSSVTFANSLELFLDRFAPTVASSDHTLLRRFLKNTFFFSRNAIENTPVNAKMFVLGALVMGGVDTACVAVQYLWAVPVIAMLMSHHVGPEMRARINETFDPNNPDTKSLVLQDTVRTGLSWLQSGASSYSQDARSQQIEGVEKEVDARLRALGIDPTDAEHQTERRDAIEKKMNTVMKQKGLPDKSEFLFDANTLFANIPKALGYDTPEELASAETFILKKRFGLTQNALARAVNAAKAWVTQDSSPTAAQTLAILEESERNMSILRGAAKDGKAGIARARAARQQLTLLSYEGGVSTAVRYLPEAWSTTYSPEAASAAGLIFRQSLFSYLAKEGDALVMAPKDQVKKYAKRAREIAREQLVTAHPGLTEITPSLQFELKLRTQLEITQLAELDEQLKEAKTYEPPKLDWLGRRQQARALRASEARLGEYLKTPGAAQATDVQIAALRNTYMREALAREVGLSLEKGKNAERADYVALIAKVEQKTVEGIQAAIKADPKLDAYLASMSAPERATAMSVMYANDFLQNYKVWTTDMSMTEDQMVKPTDPAQPGRFQKLRQTEVVRSSPFLTRTLRAFEAFGDDQNLKLGLYGVISRNVPLANDLISTHRRSLKTILPSMTIGYAWNYYVWNVHMPYSAWGIFVVTAAATISTPSQWLNRVFRVEGLKPMDSVMSKVIYALPYSWVTFVGMFPVLLYQKSVDKWFSDYIRSPFMSVLDHLDTKVMVSAALAGVAGVVVKKLVKKPEFSELRRSTPPKESKAPLICAELFR